MESASPPTMRFTAIWQSKDDGADWPLRDWLMQLFEPFISNHVFDAKHEIVMDNVILFDSFIYVHDPEYYKKFHGKNAFLVHLGDEFLELGADRYVHFRGVFRNIWSSVFNPRHVMVLPLGYYNKGTGAIAVPASDRRYAWSFVGEGAKVSRPDMVRAMSPIEPHMCFSSTPIRGLTFFSHSPTGRKKVSKQDFVQLLRQSAFAPSPMGNATLESCRVYDALETGAIPIIEKRWTLDYFKDLLGDHPLPTITSWNQAHDLVVRLLKDPVKLDELQQACIQWWKSYQSALIGRIEKFLEERSVAKDELVPLQSRLPQLAFWQYAELLRHHNMPALGRRVVTQLTRATQQRKWRLASTRRDQA
jgi:hypothetical protein